MSHYEIRYFKNAPTASLVVMPDCHSEGMARRVAQYYLLPEFTRAEIWVDLERIDVLMPDLRLH